MRFDFVSEHGKRQRQRDQATKHLIRKRATQAAALTKHKEGTTRRNNPLQLPPWVINENAREADKVEGRHVIEGPIAQCLTAPATTINNMQINAHLFLQGRRASLCDQPRCLSPTISKQNVPSLLSAPAVQAHLVGSLLSRFTLTKDHIRISKLLKLSDPEYLAQLSDKYGQSSTLDAAIICLVARIKEFLNAPIQIEYPRYLYGRALQTLQQSICDESTELIENLWFSTTVLALFELLDASSPTPWILHTKGAVNMLKQVGACNIVTEPRKILLATQTPIIIIEALITADTCFLDEPEWQMALHRNSARGPPLHFRSEMIVQLFMFAAKIPNLFNEVTDAIRTSTTNVVPDLQRRLRDVKSTCAIWNACWMDMLNHVYDDPEIEAKRVFHWANSCGYSAIIDRLLLALDTSQCLDLETTALANARQAEELAGSTSSIRLAYARVISQSIIRTSAQWQKHCMFTTESLVSKAIFLDWGRSMHRPVEAALG